MNRKPCSLMIVGEEMMSDRRLGFACPKDSPHRERYVNGSSFIQAIWFDRTGFNNFHIYTLCSNVNS